MSSPKFTESYVKRYLQEGDRKYSIQQQAKKALCYLARSDSALAFDLLETTKQLMPQWSKRKTMGVDDVRSVYLIRCRTLKTQPDEAIVALFAEKKKANCDNEEAAAEEAQE